MQTLHIGYMAENMQIKINPASSLNKIIDSYIFRSVNVDAGFPINKLMPCRHTSSIDFFLGDEYKTTDLQTKNTIPFARCTIRGPRTYKKYEISLKGNFKSFSIRFKSTGIHQLLGIPMHNFTNEATDASLVNPLLFNEIISRLLECSNSISCISVVEPYFLKILSSSRPVKITVDKLADILAKPFDFITSSYNCQLTQRQIERNFIKEIGINPKLYSSLNRFENVLSQKILHPEKKWTELAYDNRFFDQMHLIKDFHRFLGIKPSGFCASQFAF